MWKPGVKILFSRKSPLIYLKQERGRLLAWIGLSFADAWLFLAPTACSRQAVSSAAPPSPCSRSSAPGSPRKAANWTCDSNWICSVYSDGRTSGKSSFDHSCSTRSLDFAPSRWPPLRNYISIITTLILNFTIDIWWKKKLLIDSYVTH